MQWPAYRGPVRGYGQFCPVAQAAEVLAARWTPLVVRELLTGSRRFNDIQRGVPLMSSTLLSKRLRELEKAGIVTRHRVGTATEYELTRAGAELGPVIDAMGQWSERWLRRPITAADADVRYLMWDVRYLVDTGRLPRARTVIEFRFPEEPEKFRYWWLVLQRPGVELCLADPGFEIDLAVTSSAVALAQVVAGDVRLSSALRSGAITLAGTPQAVRSFRDWFGISPFAEVRPAAPRI